MSCGKERIMDCFTAKETEIAAEIERLEKKLDRLKDNRHAIEQCVSGPSRGLQTMPAMLYLPLEENGVSYKVNNQQTIKRWMEAMPAIKVTKIVMNKDGQMTNNKGLVVREDVARILSVPIHPSVIRYPEGTYFVQQMDHAATQPPAYEDIYQYILGEHFHPRTDMLASILFSYNNGGRQHFISVAFMGVV